MMTNSITYCDVVYDQNTDWRSFLRDAVQGHIYKGLELDRHFGLSMQNALGALSEALRGTPMETGLADAALELIDHGTDEQRDIVESTGWQHAPNGFERVLAIVERRPRSISKLWIRRLYDALFELDSSDPRLLQAFEHDLRESEGEDLKSLLSTGAAYNIAWICAHLRSIAPPAKIIDWHLLARPGMKRKAVSDSETLERNRDQLLSAIAGLSDQHVEAAVQSVQSLPPDGIREPLLAAMKRQSAFAKFLST